MISLKDLLRGKQKIGDSRPWDLTEKVPLRESWWFWIGALLIGLFVVLVAVLLLTPGFW